jgi:ferredoxin--NADP+ reductase
MVDYFSSMTQIHRETMINHGASMSNWQTATILDRKVWDEGLISLTFDLKLEPFKAGQFIKVGLQVGDERIERPYSLVNSEEEHSNAEILFNEVEDGPLTSRLAQLNKGDQLLATTDAHGFLVLDEVPEVPHLWMIATGTGIGPFISMLNSGQSQRFERIVIIHGTMHEKSLAYRNQLEGLQHIDQRITYLPVISREKTDGLMEGRITDNLSSGEVEKRANLELNAEQSHVLLCGNIDMIRDVQALLAERDMKKHRRFEPGHISMEKYH